MPTTALDPDRCYRAAQSRDERFDGWFYIAVRTTGIYCRPSCPAITPKRANVEFHPTAAAAQQRGFRACKRCRPDASPGSPEWDMRSDLVARAMRLIADGEVDRHGVAGLTERLGYSERHLHRLLTDELGAGPLALARSRRAQTARTLIETTDLTMTDIAFAAGFGSVRQFNDTVREVYASSPTDLRRRSNGERSSGSGSVAVRLPVRRPFAAEELVGFVAAHNVTGIEHLDETGVLHRALRLPHGQATAALRPTGDAVHATLSLSDWRDLAPAVERIRRWLDLDADPVAVDAVLAADPTLAPHVTALPGIRSPGSVDPFETAIRTVIGQQVSLAGAAAVTARIVHEHGHRLDVDHDHLTHVFPTAERLATADPTTLPLPRQRAATVQRLAAAVAGGDLVIDHAADRGALRSGLLAIKGIGPWSVGHIEMRALGDPDVFLAGDLVAQRALAANGLDPTATDRWRPWRSYATRHLWNTVWSPR